jgi:predicted SnoaL-like aldol condensation-catalyzing enzyme
MSQNFNIEQNKRVAKRWLRLISEGNVEAICQITDPNWQMHGGLPGLPPGPEGVRKLFTSFGPIEQQWTIEDVIAEGNRVVLRAINNCHQESFLGLPTFGRHQTFTATFILRIEQGKVVETWRNADDLGRILQIGATILPASKELN